MQSPSPYKYSVLLSLPFHEADHSVREALQSEGFGIISEIDMQAKLKEKLGVEHQPHTILGACNPKLAFEALQDNPDVALALPCNVVLEERAGKTVVTALLPSVALQPFQGPQVRSSAYAAEAALNRVFDSLSPLSHP